MCRHLAYVGPPVAPADPLWHAPHALVRQARAPRLQVSGTDNPDGYGVAWYDAGRPGPHRYRTPTAMWEDRAFADTIAAVRTPALVAAARLASPGAPVEESGNAPFVSGPWSFSLNGYVHDFADGVGDVLRTGISDVRLGCIEGHADSEVLFAMVLDRLDRGAAAPDAVTDTIAAVERITTGRLNCILHDGHTVIATAVGNSLFARRGWVASEALDDDPEWAAVPDRSVVTLTAGGEPMPEPLA